MNSDQSGSMGAPDTGIRAKVRHGKRRVRFQMRLLWARTGYRPTVRLLHHFNLHHTRRIGPLEPDGAVVHRCEWCGMSRTEYTMEGLRRKMATHRAASDELRNVD